MTNLFKKQGKQAPLAAVAVLSILFGVQFASLASITDPGDGSLPGSYNYGFNSEKAGEILFPGDPYAAFAYMQGRCTAHYSKATDVNECEYGGIEAE